jgi:quercetin dioxygenase-like cupin family protein
MAYVLRQPDLKTDSVGSAPMPHPDPHVAPDLTPLHVGEVWENPVTGEHGTFLELPHQNRQGRLVAELIARVGAKVVGEHRHPIIVEHFTTLEGELTVKRNGKTSILREGQSTTIEANEWHDWWNASDHDVRVRVEVTPGERFLHMIETFWGLARLGHTDANGMPHLLQLALCAQEFSDVIAFRSPPLAVQRVMFGALAPLARWRGYRATYPQLSRTVLASRN